MESLLRYRKSVADGQVVDAALDSLRRGEFECRVLKFSGADRPVWEYKLSTKESFYFTIGQGRESAEVRIVYFGSRLPATSTSYKELLFLAGESPFWNLPDVIELEDETSSVRCPPFPERKLASP